MKFLFAFLALLSIQFMQAQTKMYVVAESGLNMRTQPDKKSGKIMRIPYGAEVQMNKTKYNAETVEQKKGNWRKIVYKGKTGFVFDAFLSETKAGTAKVEIPKNPAKDQGQNKSDNAKPASANEAKCAAFLIYDDGTYSTFDVINDNDVFLWNTIIGEGSAGKPSVKTFLRVQASASLVGKPVRILVEDLNSKKILHDQKHNATSQPIDVILNGTGCGKVQVKVSYEAENLATHSLDFKCGN